MWLAITLAFHGDTLMNWGFGWSSGKNEREIVVLRSRSSHKDGYIQRDRDGRQFSKRESRLATLIKNDLLVAIDFFIDTDNCLGITYDKARRYTGNYSYS